MITPLWLVEKVYIEYALEVFRGNRTHTAHALQISIRGLRNKIRLYRETPPGIKPENKKITGVRHGEI